MKDVRTNKQGWNWSSCFTLKYTLAIIQKSPCMFSRRQKPSKVEGPLEKGSNSLGSDWQSWSNYFRIKVFINKTNKFINLGIFVLIFLLLILRSHFENSSEISGLFYSKTPMKINYITNRKKLNQLNM